MTNRNHRQFDIAKAEDGRIILYATDGNIKKVGNATVNSLINKGSRQNSNFHFNPTTSPSQSQGKNSESRKLDTEYMSAVESGDMETVQSMVDEAARAAGYTQVAFHGTEAELPFTVFKTPAFFSSDRKVARTYATDGTDIVYNVYLNTDGYYIIDGNGTVNSAIPIPKDLWEYCEPEYRPYISEYTGKVKHGTAQTNVVVTAAQKAGYPGIVFKNIKVN